VWPGPADEFVYYKFEYGPIFFDVEYKTKVRDEDPDFTIEKIAFNPLSVFTYDDQDQKPQVKNGHYLFEIHKKQIMKPEVNYVYFLAARLVPNMRGFEVLSLGDISFKPKEYSNPQDFIANIQETLNVKISEVLIGGYKSDYDGRALFPDKEYFKAEMLDKRFKLSLLPSVSKLLRFSFDFNGALSWKLGLAKTMFHSIHYNFENLSDTEHDKVLFWEATPPIDLNRSDLKALWIFTDVVKPTYVDSAAVPLLRCVAINENTKLTSYESAAYVHYVPLCRDFIDDVRIWMSDTYSGTPIHARGNVFVRLDFLQLE
jgi:hypothetical protein